mmetsp:Transcript_22315/g.50983  ORF Transcript_22315/g.50983 Transcript_22315/m.50983 type:complete len:208 (-) Transcript_22315:165-788(-)
MPSAVLHRAAVDTRPTCVCAHVANLLGAERTHARSSAIWVSARRAASSCVNHWSVPAEPRVSSLRWSAAQRRPSATGPVAQCFPAATPVRRCVTQVPILVAASSWSDRALATTGEWLPDSATLGAYPVASPVADAVPAATPARIPAMMESVSLVPRPCTVTAGRPWLSGLRARGKPLLQLDHSSQTRRAQTTECPTHGRTTAVECLH